MKCFQMDLNQLPKILLLGKESLIPPKTHLTRRLDEYVLYCVTGGKLHISVNDKELTLVPGDIYIFEQNDYQAPLASEYCEYYYIHFRSDTITAVDLAEDAYAAFVQNKHENYMRTDAFDGKCYDFLDCLIRQENHISDSGLFKEITDCLQANIMNAGHKEPLKRLELSAAVSSVFLQLESTHMPKLCNTPSKPERTYDTVRRIAEYIEESCAEPISSSDIEKKFYLTFDHSNRIFRKVMGCTIFRYRNIVRIQYAKAKLRASNMSICDIAAELGFDSVHYFSRIFKQIEGLSPSDYKRKFMKITDYDKEDTQNEKPIF